MVLSFSVCNVSVMPIRLEPSHRSEQVNELLFGERAEILELNENDWARIRVELDGYEGWCRLGQLSMVSRKDYRKAAKHMCASHNSRLAFSKGELWVPLGADLHGLKSGKIIVGAELAKYKGKKLSLKKTKLDTESIKVAAIQYLHAPYRWGGRSIAGIDCSGLTQMAFKLCGKAILRDAAQQATEGVLVDFLQNAQCADLAFFENKDGKIVHVGILLDNQTIIHATDTSGKVVIDRIDQGGIISVSLKRRTHNLRMVRRVI